MYRKLVWGLVALAFMALATACPATTVKPTPPAVYLAQPPACPYPSNVVQLNGDSVGIEVANRLVLPEHLVFNAAQGGSGFAWNGYAPTIRTRVEEWITACGTPKLLIVEGGINDLTHGVDVAGLTTAVAELSAATAALGVPTLWVTMHPVPVTGGAASLTPSIQAYNEWLTTPDSVAGPVVDCMPDLQDADRPGSLDPKFYRTGDLFKPDSIHLNSLGYQTFAACVATAAEPLLAAV